MTLTCSKHAYEELVEKQDLETFLRCHERAFAFFGGVPAIVTIDNLKAGVIEASIFDPVLNETYLMFASHWGFAANPCMPFRPEHKGVVERDISYTRHNALDGRTLTASRKRTPISGTGTNAGRVPVSAHPASRNVPDNISYLSVFFWPW